MENIFLKILNISITASWLVLAVLLMRLLLRKAPRYITVIMWALVGIRLLLPFSFESALSLIPSTETVPPEILYETAPQVHTGIGILNNAVNPVISESFAPTPGASVNPLQVITFLAGWIWVTGMAAMAIYTLISCLRIRRKLREAIPLRENIYLCDRIETPFIFGLFRPKIYLPSSMAGADVPLVLAHEQAHLKRKDHFWKPLGFLLLTVYWFNPLMWVAYILLCRDIETACDEKVLRDMGEEVKKPYSQALINCSVPRKMIAACPLAFGEVSVKSRIKKVLSYKKPAFWLLIAAVVVCLVLSVCFLTNPRTVNDQMQVFLDCTIADHFQTEKSAGNACCLDYEILGTKKKGKETTVYMWVLYEEFSYENGKLQQQTGSHIPTVITARKENGNYQLAEYWEPRDGGYYTDDIREKFPMRLWLKALDSQRYIDRQKKACRELAEEYFKENAYSTPTGSVIHIPDQSVTYDDLGLNMTLVWEDGGTLNAVFQYEPATSQAGFPTTTQEYQLYAIHDGKRWPFEDHVRKVLGQDYPAREPVTEWTIYTIKAGEQTAVPIDLSELGMELPPGSYELVKEVTLQIGDMRYKKEYSVPFAILDSALTDPNAGAAHKEYLEYQLAILQKEAEVRKLQELYPQYLNNLAKTGMTVYVWQMAAGSYQWGLMPQGEVYAWDDFEKLMPFSLEELHAIIDVCGLEKEQVTICPIQVIYSSYLYNINDAYINNVTTLFWSWNAESATANIGALIDSAVFDIDGDGKEETCTLYDGLTSGVFSFTFSVFEGDKLEYRNTFTAPHGKLHFVPQDDGTMGIGHTLNTDAVKIYSIVASGGNITLLDGDSMVSYIGLQGVGKYQEYTEYSIIQSGGVAYTVSYAGSSGNLNGIFQEALNKETFYISSLQHLPVLKFDTLEELEQFKHKYGIGLSGSADGWAEVPSFHTVSLRYDEEFFKDRSLVLVYVPCGNCTHRFDVKHVFSGRDSLSIRLFETTGTEEVADVEANWFVAVELYDTEAKSITDYDAILETP